MAGGGGQGQGYTSNTGSGQMYGQNAYADRNNTMTPFSLLNNQGMTGYRALPQSGGQTTDVAPAQPNPQTLGGGIAGLLGNGYNFGHEGMGGDQDVIVHGRPVDMQQGIGGLQQPMQQQLQQQMQQPLQQQMQQPLVQQATYGLGQQQMYSQQPGFIGGGFHF